MSFVKQKFRVWVSRYFEIPITSFMKWKIGGILNRSQDLILIHTIGKVGSSSVYQSVADAFPENRSIFHIHSLNQDRNKEQELYYRSSKRGSVPLHLIISRIISDRLSSYKGQILVITLIREPISRELSSVYQDYFNFSDDKNISADWMRNVIKKKVQEMATELPEEKWFKSELLEVFGVDVFKQKFDVAKGYFNLKDGNVVFALIRLEDLNDKFADMMLEMFGKQGVKLVRENDSSDKFYDAHYKEEMNELRIDSSTFDRIIGQRFVTHFYSDKLNQLSKKWKA